MIRFVLGIVWHAFPWVAIPLALLLGWRQLLFALSWSLPITLALFFLAKTMGWRIFDAPDQ